MTSETQVSFTAVVAGQVHLAKGYHDQPLNDSHPAEAIEQAAEKLDLAPDFGWRSALALR